MKYKYSDRYGDHSIYDEKVYKALIQNMKEDRLPFTKLLMKIQGEMVKEMHSSDKYKLSPWECLSLYKGHSTYGGDLSQYWVEQLKQS